VTAVANVPDGNLAHWLQRHFAHGERWLGGAALGAVAGDAPYASEAPKALAALRDTFPWPWLAELADAGARHPIVQMQLWRAAVPSLVQLGVTLSRHPRVAAATRKHLRSAEHFASAVAELQVGLWLEQAGATLRYEPEGADGRRVDWLASWPDLRVSVEVKQPRPSTQGQKALHAEYQLMDALMRHPAFPRPTEPAWLTMHVLPALAEHWNQRGDVSAEEFARISEAIVPALAHRLPTPTRNCVIELGRVVAFEVELMDRPGPAAFQISGYGPQYDLEHESDRVAKTLFKASRQLHGASDLRIVVVHLGQDSLITNYVDDVRRRLATARWARDIDGVVLMGCLNERMERYNRLISGGGHHADLARFAERLGLVIE